MMMTLLLMMLITPPCRAKGIDGLHEGGKVETVSYEKPGNMILTQGAEVCILTRQSKHLNI